MSPLKKGSSQKVISSNIGELMRAKPSVARAKGIATLAAKLGISKKAAEQKQTIAIAFSKAGKSRKAKKA